MKKLLLPIITLLLASGSMFATIDPAEFSTDPIVPPEGLVTKQYEWEMRLSYTPTEGRDVVKVVNVGFTEDEVYVQGVSDEFPEAWIKGSLSEDKIVMQSGQCFGCDMMMGLNFYFCSGKIEYVMEGENVKDVIVTPIEEMVFDYDAETGAFETQDDFINMIYDPNYPEGGVNFWGFYRAPKAKPLVWKADTPVDPQITFVEPYNPDTNMCLVVVRFDNVGVDGNYMNPENLYYNMYLDGEKYVFPADLYRLKEDTTDIPYTYETYNGIEVLPPFFYIDFFQPMTEVGAQLHYVFEGETYSSNIVTFQVSGLDDVEVSDIQSVEYYNLSGIQVANPENGIFIKVARDSKGNKQVSKALFK
ncbi:MAG: hypothetical protein HUK13_08050 [Muribaculaceae bacterium]|nr:hypothetical protein [Muribaculaceae bacterium]